MRSLLTNSKTMSVSMNDDRTDFSLHYEYFVNLIMLKFVTYTQGEQEVNHKHNGFIKANKLHENE